VQPAVDLVVHVRAGQVTACVDVAFGRGDVLEEVVGVL
jgi:hypothetical protein